MFGLRFIGPFWVATKLGIVSYRLDLLDEVGHIHSSFYVSRLRKYVADKTVVVPLNDIQVDDT